MLIGCLVGALEKNHNVREKREKKGCHESCCEELCAVCDSLAAFYSLLQHELTSSSFFLLPPPSSFLLPTFKDESILNIGGNLLAKVSEGKLEEALANMAGGCSPALQKFAVELISNMALNEGNADKIVANGGVGGLISQFNSKGSVEAAARALGRLAMSKVNVDAIIADGAVGVLVSALQVRQ